MQLIFVAMLLAALDVDGDGTVDTVEVAGGQVKVVVAGKSATAPFAGDGVATVEEAAGHRLLVVRGGGAIFLGDWHDATLRTLWTGEVGPQGVDGEWTREIEIGAAGVLLYETRGDVRRCDGSAARIYPRRFDFGLGRFRPVTLAAVPEGATPLLAARGAAAGLTDDTAPTVFRFEAATVTADDGGAADGLSAPRELDDGRRDTAWSEAQPGFGRGAVFVARAETARARVLALRLVPGDASSPAAFQAANRLRRLLVTVAGKPYVVELPEDPARRAPGRPWWIVLPQPTATACVDVVIDSIYGSATGRTAISELTVLTDLDAGAGALATLATLAKAVAAGGADASDAEHTLVRQAARGTAALLAELAATGDATARRRLRGALARGGDPAAAVEVAAGLAAADNPDEGARLADALAGMGVAAAAPLARLLADAAAAPDARARAARLLGPLPTPAAREALLAAAGQGNATLRRAVILALAARPPVDGAALLAAAQAGAGAHPDVWRAIGLHAGHAPDAIAAAVTAAASARLETATGALRYRLVQTLATLGTLSAAAFAAEPDAALRVVAIESLPHPRDFIAALDDPDPGVRAAIASRLAATPDAGGEAPLLVHLAGDPWPSVRRVVADALAARCAQRPAADGLYQAARVDRDEVVRRAALAGLVRCKEPRVGRELVAIAGDAGASVPLRAYAATLAGNVGDRALVPGLLEVLGAARADALAAPDPVTGDGPVRIAAAAAHALGALDDPRAVPLLLDAAADPTLPVLQASALAALAPRCPPQTRAVAERAMRTGDALVARAARLTLSRCGLQNDASP